MNLKRKYLIMAAVLALAVSIASMPLYSTAAKTSRRGINEETTTINLGSGTVLSWGVPNTQPTPPESDMKFKNKGMVNGIQTYDIVYRGNISGYYPSQLALSVAKGNNITQLRGDSNVKFVEYNPDSTYQLLTVPTNIHSPFHTIGIQGAGSITVTLGEVSYKLRFSAPNAGNLPGASPSAINYYLPLGQFAGGTQSGFGWGDCFDRSGSTPVPEFVAGRGGSASLGALGGFIQFKFNDPIKNDNKNPYGIDFIVYGNAFYGNPEPGSVQVSSDGNTWYELAGSRYYSDKIADGSTSLPYEGTARNVKVKYTKTGGDINALVTPNNASTPTILAANPFTSALGWWPETNEGYPMGDGSNVTNVSYGSNVITYKGLTAIKDSDTHTDYNYGYADVTPNGSNIGQAVNPYVPCDSSKSGGDGFDLAWAVNTETGEPAAVDNVKFVRVYSSVLHNTGVFGETSPDLTSIRVTANPASSNVGSTSAPRVRVNGRKVSFINGQATVNNAGTNPTVQVTGSNSYIYINETYGSNSLTKSINRENIEKVRVIVQQKNSAKRPWIGTIKFN